MHTVQRDGERNIDTEIVYYDGTEELKPGYAVCYDPAAPKVEAAGEFAENILGRRVAKPATANLHYFAGIVVEAPQKRMGVANSFKGFCRIAPLRRGQFVNAAVVGNVSTTSPPTTLRPTDGQWHLVPGAVDTVANYRLVVGITAETNASAVATTPTVIMGVNG
jgi:hypothetical protein